MNIQPRRTARSILAAPIILLAFVLGGAGVPAWAGPRPAPPQSAAPAGPATTFPPVSPEELALKDNPAHPGAPAMILYREHHADDVKRFSTHYFRIKIFTEEGKKHANVEIPYVEKNTEVFDIRARTIRPDGEIVAFRGEVFDRLLVRAKKRSVQAKTFTLPAVETGGIIEYSYRFRWLGQFPEILLSPERFVLWGGFSFSTEHWDVQHELYTRRARFSIQPLPKPRLVWTSYRLPDGRKLERKEGGSYVCEVENVSAFTEEELIPPERNLKSWVALYYLVGPVTSSYGFWDAYRGRQTEAAETFIGRSKHIEREAQRLVAPGDSPEIKLRKIYARVQQIRYLSYERARSEKEAKAEKLRENKSAEEVLKRGYARTNEINFLFVALARAAGFEAELTEVTSRDTGHFVEELLLPERLNALVVRVKKDQQEWYLDPATKHCPFGLLPWAEAGARGVAWNSQSPVFASTPEPVSSDAVIERTGELRLGEDGSLEGTLRIAWKGQEALTRRLDADDEDDAGRRKLIEDEVKAWFAPGATVENQSIENWDGSEEPLRATVSIRVPEFAVSTGRRLLVPMGVLQTNRSYPFQVADRKHPVYFSYPFERLDDVTVTLPDGYRVEVLPDKRQIRQEFGQVELSAERNGEQLRLRRHYVLKVGLFPREHYGRLRAFYERMRAADEEAVVLVESAGAAAAR